MEFNLLQQVSFREGVWRDSNDLLPYWDWVRNPEDPVTCRPTAQHLRVAQRHVALIGHLKWILQMYKFFLRHV